MLKVFNTLTRQKEIFTPIDPKHVKMYVCGMTVYDYCHLGHARVMVVFDMIAKWLRASGYHLTYVRNITDIDDKIIQRALENKESIYELTERFILAMNEDSAALGVTPPDFEPRATDFIPQIHELIKKLINNKLAYAAENGDVYYSVHQFPDYGKLSGKSLDDLQAGARVEIDQGKHHPLDFVLWKAAKANEPAWESPWGAGRPGWHIECSAMSCHHLGEHFDIHGGGADLQFPHHENEIAQSEGAHHGKYVNYWLHNGFIRVDNEKMSKSLGNFFTIRQVLQQFDAEVVRFFILKAHYRSPLNYSDAHLEDSKSALTRFYTTLKNCPPEANFELNWENEWARRFKAAMNDDFNTAEAIAILFELATQINRSHDAHESALLLALGNVLGLFERTPETFFHQTPASGLTEAEIEAAIVARKEARAAKNWAKSDEIRDMLHAQGILLEDGPQGTAWRRA